MVVASSWASSALAADHRATEEGLLDSGLEWTFLRNSIYAEYQVPSASQAIASGRHVHNSGDGAVSYVSRVDCAAAAAGALAGTAEPARAYDVTGPEAITAVDLAALASELSGPPIEVVALEDDAYVAGLVEHADMPEPVARNLASFGASALAGFRRHGRQRRGGVERAPAALVPRRADRAHGRARAGATESEAPTLQGGLAAEDDDRAADGAEPEFVVDGGYAGAAEVVELEVGQDTPGLRVERV